MQIEFQTPPLGFNQALKDMRRIKGSELDRDVETGAGAGPGAVHVPAGRGGRGRGAVDSGGNRIVRWWLTIGLTPLSLNQLAPIKIT